MEPISDIIITVNVLYGFVIIVAVLFPNKKDP
nr:MAG TPA: hypothetical protein [Caudoviricetes sp.]